MFYEKYGVNAQNVQNVKLFVMKSPKYGRRDADHYEIKAKVANETAPKAIPGRFTDPKASEKQPLYKTEAMQRSQDVNDVRYRLMLALLRGGKTYQGHVEIKFTLTATSAKSDQIFVDYRGEQVLALWINGEQVLEGTPFRGHRIYFPVNLLKEGENTVSVRFESKYVRDCQGIHYFVDKDDGEEYLYSQFEAADAHIAFPCFDQPDMKAPYQLMALVPKGWVALSTCDQVNQTAFSGTPEFNGQVEEYLKTEAIPKAVIDS